MSLAEILETIDILAKMLETIDISAEMHKISKSWVGIKMYNSTLSQ